MTDYQKEKRKKGFCVVPGCRKHHAPERTVCHCHYKRAYRERDLLGYTYNALRQNARRRGHHFGLTRSEFKQFCDETGYLVMKGRKPKSASIDRVNNDLGYIKGNIRMITLSENSVKGCSSEIPDCPF